MDRGNTDENSASPPDQTDTKTAGDSFFSLSNALAATGLASKKSSKVPITMSTEWQLDYKMDYPYRGKCIIFNNKFFAPQTNLNERRGTELDAQRLYQVFRLLDFDVKVYHNKTSREMRAILENVALEDHSDRDCFASCILTHGDRGVIYGTDGKFPTEQLFAPFMGDRSPTLLGKPKLFFIQACQGDKLDPGAKLLYRNGGGDMTDNGSNHENFSVIPVHSDFLIAYSTVPGYYSWRNTTQGSWFIQSLASVLETMYQDLDLLSMMTIVNYKVAYEFQSNVPTDPLMDQKKQVPYVSSMLTRRVFFVPKL